MKRSMWKHHKVAKTARMFSGQNPRKKRNAELNYSKHSGNQGPNITQNFPEKEGELHDIFMKPE